MVDLDENDFHFSGERSAVLFDIDADGLLELVTWTAAGEGDAFLCFDRNGNGEIDDGSELFGNSTPLNHGGIAPFGYIALAELDGLIYGGNGDGILSSEDRAFSELCLWTDTNHNAVTDPTELQTLTEAGITEIEANFETKASSDRFGNLLLFHSYAWRNEGMYSKRIRTTDVFFVELNP